jgi:hypothetical protein
MSEGLRLGLALELADFSVEVALKVLLTASRADGAANVNPSESRTVKSRFIF